MSILQRPLLLGLAIAAGITALPLTLSHTLGQQSTPDAQEFISTQERDTVYRGSGRREILAFPGGDTETQGS